MKIQPHIVYEGHFYYEGYKLAHSAFHLDWIKQYNINPKIIIEFGSYDAGDAIRYKINYPNCDIFSIEADPIQYKKIKPLEKFDIKIFNYAIYNKTDKIEFNRCKYTYDYYCYKKGDIAGSGSIFTPSEYNRKELLQYDYNEKIIIPTITIYDFCKKYDITNIDLMHIDVEGSTIEVLKGFDNIRPKMLFVEIDGAVPFYNNAPTFEKVNSLLMSMGYEIKYRTNVDSLYLLK